MSPRWRKVARDIWVTKTRTLLVVLSIAVGVFAVGAIVSTQLLLNAELSGQYLAVSPSSAILTTDDFDPNLIESVRRTAGVTLAEGRRVAPVQVQISPTERRSMNIIVVPDFREQTLDVIRPVSGPWPPGDREVLLERASVGLVNQPVGATLTVEAPGRRLKELHFVGTAWDLNQTPAAFTGAPWAYATRETVEWLGFPEQFNEVHIRTDNPDDKAAVRLVAAAVEAKLARGGVNTFFTQIAEPNKHPADSIIQPLLLILGVMGALSLVLSGFLVVNTIAAILGQHTRQIGIMKAIGARTGQVALMYFAMVLVYGLLSLVVAVPLGAVAAAAFTGLMTGFLNFDPAPFGVPLPSLILQVAVALLVPLLAAIYPVIAGTSVTVREAISDTSGGGNFGNNLIDDLVQRVRGLSRPLLLSIRNTVRRKARLILTLTTLVMGGAIFISVLTVYASLNAALDDALAFWDYDVQVQLTRPYRVDQVLAEAQRVPGIEAVEHWAFASGRFMRPDGTESEPFFVFGPPQGSTLLNPQLTAGRWLIPGDQNAIVVNGDLLKNDPELGPGSNLLIKVGNRELNFTIVGVVKSALAGAIAVGDLEYLGRVTETSGRTQVILVKTTDRSPEFQNDVANRLKETLTNAGVTVGSTLTIGALRQTIQASFVIVVVFLSVMAVLVAIVGGLGLMGTMSINVLERSREIGVMRAIGANDGTVMRIVLVEGVLIGLLSWAGGLVLSLPISKLLSDAVGQAFLQAPLPFTFSVNGALLWLFIVIVLAALASFLPALRASRVTVREVLAYE